MRQEIQKKEQTGIDRRKKTLALKKKAVSKTAQNRGQKNPSIVTLGLGWPAALKKAQLSLMTLCKIYLGSNSFAVAQLWIHIKLTRSNP